MNSTDNPWKDMPGFGQPEDEHRSEDDAPREPGESNSEKISNSEPAPAAVERPSENEKSDPETGGTRSSANELLLARISSAGVKALMSGARTIEIPESQFRKAGKETQDIARGLCRNFGVQLVLKKWWQF